MSGAHRAGTSGREAEAAAPPTSLPVAALSPGSVALVGGGPGALDLITVRGMQLLQQADVVIVDRLGPAALVQHLGEEIGRASCRERWVVSGGGGVRERATV